MTRPSRNGPRDFGQALTKAVRSRCRSQREDRGAPPTEASSRPILTAGYVLCTVDLVDEVIVVEVPADGFVESLEQRVQRLAFPAHEHGHAVVAVGGRGSTFNRVDRAESDLAK